MIVPPRSRLSCAVGLAMALAAPAAARPTTLVSVGMGGALANGSSSAGVISADGHWVAFVSNASNLVPGDTNARTDVFLRDLQNQTTTRVSVSPAGVQGNENSFSPAISADGRYIAFLSSASNLVANDTNNTQDLFVRDTLNQTTICVSVRADNGLPGGASEQPAISADGRFVAFTSFSPNLVPGDTNGSYDVFRRDTTLGVTQRVSLSSSGAQINAGFLPAISADGRYIAFKSSSPMVVPGDTNFFNDVFVRDVTMGTTIIASVGNAGESGNDSSPIGPIAMSADGNYVSFGTLATNLVPGYSHDFENPDCFLDPGLPQCVQTFALCVRRLGPPVPAIFAVNRSTNGDPSDNETLPSDPQSPHLLASALSSDGRFVAFISTARNFVSDGYTSPRSRVYVHDIDAGITELVSRATSGASANGESTSVSISGDGRTIVFESVASNLFPGDTPTRDVFVTDSPILPTDTDGDGLLDDWETQGGGIDANHDGTIDLDLYALGARPDRKDLFVEVDTMVGRGPPAPDGSPTVPSNVTPTGTCLDNVIEAFAIAPVGNPDQSSGISLHIQIDDTDIPVQDGLDDFQLFDSYRTVYFGTAAQRGSGNAANILAAKAQAFRYCIFANNPADRNIGGLARSHPAADFMVFQTLRSEAAWRAATFMHELGHGIGLDHGGGDAFNNKPNYISIMNYSFSYPYDGLEDVWQLDYSHVALPPLSEGNIDEHAPVIDPSSYYSARGIYMPYMRWSCNSCAQCDTTNTANLSIVPIASAPFDFDWDGNGFIFSGVFMDLNYRGSNAPFDNSLSPCETMNGFNDWANIVYAVPPSGAAARTAPPVEYTIEDIEYLNSVIPQIGCPLVTHQPQPVEVPAGGNAAFNLSVHGAPPITYQWRRNGVPLADGDDAGTIVAGALTANLTISNVTAQTAGIYDCIVANFCDPVTSATAALTLPPPANCPGDANGDAVVSFSDVTSVLANFGASYAPATGPGDANHDGAVNFADITSVLANFGIGCS